VDLTLRPAAPADSDTLYDIHERAMRGYVEVAYGPWDDADQRQRWQASFDLTTHQVIEVDGVTAGTLSIIEQPEHIFLSLIEVDPGFQGRGIGTSLVRAVMAQAAEAAVPARLQVLKANPARRLYERLGFVIYGVTDTHFLMEWKP
jgi:ribosomal protein S18 acetylase RimI-like enzyme